MTKTEYKDELTKANQTGIFPSISYGKCRYRHEDRKCAIGILIPDEKYNPNFEHYNCTILLETFPDIFEIPEGMTHTELRTVQQTHDQLASNGWDKTKFQEFIDQL